MSNYTTDRKQELMGYRDETDINILNSIYGSTLNDEYIIITASCTPFDQLIVYSTVTSIFSTKQFSNSLYQTIVDPNSKRIVIIGFASSTIYTTKFMLNSFPAHPDFSTSALVFNQLSSGTDDIVSESSISFNDVTSELVSIQSSFTNILATYIVSPIYTSYVFFGLNKDAFIILENTSMNVVPSLPCSSLEGIIISFTLGSYNKTLIPSWVSINSSTGELTINSPEVSADTDVYFYVNSKITGTADFVQTVVKVTVKDCPVQNCLKCQSIGSSVCIQCYLGYTLNNGIGTTCSKTQSSGNTSDSKDNATNKPAITLRIVLQVVFATTALIEVKFKKSI